MKRIVFIIIFGTLSVSLLALITFTALEYRATEIPEKECKVVTGIISKVSEGGIKDAVFRLHSDETEYYINRALDSSYTVSGLEEQLLGKNVAIYFSDHKSVLGGEIPTFQIRKLMIGNDTFYTEY